MVTAAGSLDATFRALADPTRRAMLARLAVGEATVTELAEPFDVSLPAVSKHLRVLEGAGLLARERDGRRHRCRLLSGPLMGAAEWIDQSRRFWEARLDALDRYLEKEEPSWRRRPSGKRPHSISRGRSRPRGPRSSERGRTRRG